MKRTLVIGARLAVRVGGCGVTIYEILNDRSGKWVRFTDCHDMEEALERFQWRYGFWPVLRNVREVTA